MRKTLVVHSRYAWRCYRTRAALAGEQGLQLLTIEQAAARLAGGFLQPIDHDECNAAVAAALGASSMGELDGIKALPGFQRAASEALTKAWAAGINLEEESRTATDPSARARLVSLAGLEKEVLTRLPKNQLRPRDLVTAALERAEHIRAVFGRIEIRGRTEMSPVWRPLLSAIAERTELVWIAEARYVPEWLAAAGVKVEMRDAEKPALRAISCASPRHEILEALRWARQRLARGASPQDIAIAAAAPDMWDDHMLALSEAANLPIHFVHGRAALTTSEGQLAAALAEILLRGFSRARVTRLVALLRSQTSRFAPLPGGWWRALPEDAPLLDAARWRRAIAALAPECFSDGANHRPLLLEIVETVGKGLNSAAAALGTWTDWHRERITAHDGRMRANHPLLLRALDRRQSASSLVKLLRDPLGYLWTYGFGWSAPEETDEPLSLDPLAFGNLLHEVLQEAVTRLERRGSGGFANASIADLTRDIESASRNIVARWQETRPVPPPVIWERKRAEAAELAVTALSHRDNLLPGQRSWAEIPFGGDRRAEELDAEAKALLPWDPLAPVSIPETAIQIGGSIDRLDLAGDGSRARVTDYKSGRLRSKPPQLRGGAELQRCLYAYAVKALVAEQPQVEAELIYPREDGRGLPLENPEAALAKLTGYLTAASALFAAGLTIPGPAADEDWYDLAFALPGGAQETYLTTMRPLAARELGAIAALWDEP